MDNLFHYPNIHYTIILPFYIDHSYTLTMPRVQLYVNGLLGRANINTIVTTVYNPNTFFEVRRVGKGFELHHHVCNSGDVSQKSVDENVNNLDITEDELKSIIAHEIGHIYHDHLRKRSITLFVPIFLATNAVPLTILNLCGIGIGKVPIIGLLSGSILSYIGCQWYSRYCEYEADSTVGLLYPELKTSFKHVLEKLDRLESKKGFLEKILSSHPSYKERLSNL